MKTVSAVIKKMTTYFFTFAATVLLGSIPAFGQNIINANSSNYVSLVSNLQPGETLLLEAGSYNNLLRITSLNGEPGNPIIIMGPESGPRAVLLGQLNTNTVELRNSSYVELRNLEINCQYISSGVISKTVNHHITLENLYIHSFSDHQQTVGIAANHDVSWNWIIRNNVITDGGTGIYLGDSDGDSQFINGIIENNLIYDTIGYNMEIKHQIPRPTNIPGMPTGKSVTIIRNNVFSKANNSSGGIMARPNLLVGHFPTSGSGTHDEYHIYGNFLNQNPYEPLFQGEGNIAFYNNLLVNSLDSAYAAIYIRPHHDLPKKIRIFNNTVVSKNRGIFVSGGDPSFQQIVIGNAVFSDIPISAADQRDNIFDSYLNAVNYVNYPFGQPGTDLDLYPKQGMLKGTLIDQSSFSTFTDWNKDFNGILHDGTFRGSYSGEGNNSGWQLKLDRKPIVMDTSAPTVPQSLNISAISSSQLDLTWQASSDSESGITKYIIYRDNSNIGESTTTSFSDSELTESTTYAYEVTAVNGGGLESAKSTLTMESTLADTAPPTITSVSSNGNPTKVHLVFSELIEQTEAINPSNYQINNNITISSIVLGLDHKTVTITTSPHIEGTTYKVIVNNIRDRALTPNTITPNTQATYTFDVQLVINNLSVSSGRLYEVMPDGLHDGSIVYIDRVITFSSVPIDLEDATYIKTANDDKGSDIGSFISFDINQNVTVYVAHDYRIISKPSWMALFTDTKEDIVTTDSTLSVYARDFPAGTVILGGNEGAGYSMYSIAVKPKSSSSSPDSISPSPPAGLRKK